ncbi:MAG TPA: hypothetical protein VNW46_12660 [Gemmatimonadaceae bacterium]|jgi:hypothetical protein|nr:hypothetical protein [Gemmatimonadaceae bacterium]
MIQPAPEWEAFRARWAARHDEFARFQASVDGATLCSALLADLDATLADSVDALIPLRDAARQAGMHPDSLRRLARTNRLATVRRGRRLYFRLRDLPCKSPRVDGRVRRVYDPTADAQLVADRRNRGD